MDADFGESSLMYHASCPARAVTFLPWHSKVQTRVGIRSLEFVFSPLPARMRSSVVAHSMVIKESCGEVDSVLKLDYPVPLSPVPSQLSNEVELQRALVAEAAMKSRPAIGRESVLFEDEWLIIVNKPRGLYSGHVFETMPSLCSSSGWYLTLILDSSRYLLLCIRTFSALGSMHMNLNIC